jgi:hypothetical protein
MTVNSSIESSGLLLNIDAPADVTHRMMAADPKDKDATDTKDSDGTDGSDGDGTDGTDGDGTDGDTDGTDGSH